MKPFEEQYTAWIDGRLTGRELADFEAQLEEGFANGLTKAQAEADRAAAGNVGALLRGHFAQAPAPALKNAEFFNHQILRQIEAETQQSTPPASAPLPWPFWRMIWGGLSSLGVAALLFVTLVMPTLHRPGPPPEYYAQILNASTEDSAISAVAIHSKQENVTVLWIDGLDYVPATKAKN